MEIVHPVPVEAVEPWFASMVTTFLEDPVEARTNGAVRRTRHWNPQRRWGAYDGGRWVATLGTYERAMSVPGGGVVSADALSMVTVAATHRRQGILSTMLTASLDEAHERGDLVSILIAAEWAIYGRFGYAPAAPGSSYTAHPRQPGGAIPPDGPLNVRQVDGPEQGDVLPGIFDRAWVQRAGNIDRPESWWDAHLGRNGLTTEQPAAAVTAVHRGPTGDDGFVNWRPTRESTLAGGYGEIVVSDLHAENADAYRALWQYLTGIDLIDEIVLHRRPIDEPVRWLLRDGRTLHQNFTGDGMWLRLLDVPRALAARSYGCPGRLVIEVIDKDPGGYAAGRYLLEAGPDGASCAVTTESADLAMSQHALASAYVGGYSFRSRSALIDELRPGTLTLADAMFSTGLAPWCATMF